MNKIKSLFVFNKVDNNGNARTVACINGDTFINAKWLASQTELTIASLPLLVGSSIEVEYFVEGEVLQAAEGDIAEKLCTKNNTIVKSFSVEYSIALTVAKMYKAA